MLAPVAIDALDEPAARVVHLLHALDEAHRRTGEAHRALLELVAELDRTEAWRDDGARDAAHWLSMRYDISTWKAHRWIGAAHALERLPRLADALSSGTLGIDKVLEVARFATPETEADLVRWAREVSCATVRRRGDVAARTSDEDVRDAESSRTLSWWWTDEGRRLGLEAELPAAQGTIVVRAITRLTEQIPVMPGEEDGCFIEARRADALVALCSGTLAERDVSDRAMVVVHAPLAALRDADEADEASVDGCETEEGAPVPLRTVERLLCSARMEAVVTDATDRVVALGRGSRRPPAWMLRQVRYRDRGCRFPGCGTRAFTEAHHLVWWSRGGRTEPDNLLLICSFHHKLVHELGWSVRRDDDGEVRWFRADGTGYRAGPSP
jgi:hypothetical protein